MTAKRTTRNVLARMREEWAKAADVLFAGPKLPTRQQVYDEAMRVVIRSLVADGAASITEVAELSRTSRRAMRDTMRRLGLYFCGQAPPLPHRGTQWAEVPDLHTASVPDLAARYGVTPQSVRKARVRHAAARREAA